MIIQTEHMFFFKHMFNLEKMSLYCLSFNLPPVLFFAAPGLFCWKKSMMIRSSEGFLKGIGWIMTRCVAGKG